ncbi:hypothetical protein [Sedimenticola sp.]|uniref:hypothetical protein n=1 Tax=Sedimenticola sp. TaxID=1940285 RepID=UPI003D0F688A
MDGAQHKREDRLAAARVHLDKGDLSSAIDLLKMRLTEDENDLEALLLLAVALFRAGFATQSRGLFERVINQDASSYTACYYLGLGLEREHRLADAVCYYRRAARLRPDFKPALNRLALYASLPDRTPTPEVRTAPPAANPEADRPPTVQKPQSRLFRFFLFLVWVALLAGGAGVGVLVTQQPLAALPGLIVGHLISIPLLGRFNPRRVKRPKKPKRM